MRKVGFICLTLLAALAILGASYAQWSKNDYISTQVSTAPAPVLGSPSASVNVAGNSVTLSGTLSSLGTTDSVTTSFMYGTSPGSLTQQVSSGTMYGTGTFNANILSLTPGTTYYYQSQVQGLYTVTSDIGSFVYNSPLAVQATLPAGQVGAAYSGNLAVSGGTSPYTWTIASGSLPHNLSLNSSNGAITGMPDTSGPSSFTVTVTDNALPTHNTLTSGTLSITIKPAVSVLDHIAITPNNPSIATGAQVTFYAQGYDSGDNPISGLSYTWSCTNATAGTIVSNTGVFTAGSTPGTYSNVITATSGSVTGYASVIVTGGTANHISIETSPYGSGIVVPSQNLTSGNAITVYAVSRDAGNNFVANVAVTWSLTNITGGIVIGDLVPGGDNKSAVFTGHVTGSATIHAASTSTADSGTITVTAGAATKLVFTQQPSGGAGSSNFGTQPIVTVEDAYNNTVTSPSIPIALAIGTNPSGGTLSVSGGNPISSVSGVATFSGVSINWAGTGYTLTATSGNLTVTSNSFNITSITRTWTGTGTSDNFSTANHWTGNSVPGPGDSLVIVSPGTDYCNFDNTANNFVYGTLTLGSGSTPGTLQWPASGTNTLQVTNISAAVIGSAINMTNGGTLQLSGSWTTTNMTFTAGTGTVNYTGTSQTLIITTYYNLTLSGGAETFGTITTVTRNLTLSGTATATNAANLTIGGNLSIGDGTTFTAAGFALTVSGTTTVGAGTTGNLTISSATGTKIFTGLVTINAGGTWNNSGNSPITFRGGITTSPTFTAGSGVQTFDTNSQALNGTFIIPSMTVTGITLTNNNTLTVATALIGTGGLTQAASATLNIGGTSTITTLTATNTGNTVNYTGTGQTLKVTSYYNLTLSGGAETFGAITTITGNLTLSGSATATTGAALAVGVNLNIGNGTTFTAAGFALTVSGTTTVGAGTTGNLTISSATGTKIFTGLVTINAGGTWNNSGNSPITFRGGITTSPTFTAGSGVQTFDTNSQALNGTFIIPSVTVTGITLTNNNTLTVATALIGTGGLTQAGSATLNIGGTSTITTLTATNTGNTVNYTGAAAQIAQGVAYNLMKVNNTVGVTMSGAATITTLTIGDVTANSVFNDGGFVISGSTLNLTSGTYNLGSATIGTTWPVWGTYNITAGTTIGYISGVTQTVSTTQSYPNLTMSGAGVKTIAAGTLSITGNWSVTAGAAGLNTNNASVNVTGNIIGTGPITSGSGTITVGGNWTNNGTFTAGTGTVNYNAAGIQTVGSVNYYNLTLSGSAAKTLQAGTTTISGTLTLSGTATTATVVGLTVGALNIGDGTTFTAAGFALTVSGTTTVGAGTSGTLAVSAAAGTKIFTGLVTISAGGTWNNSGNSPITFRGGITTSPTFTAGSGVQTFDTNSQALNGTFIIPSVTVTGITLTNNNTLTVATALIGTGGLTQAASATLNIGGTSTITTLTATNTGNTVNYTGAAQTVKAVAYSNLILSGSGAKSMLTGTSVSTNGNLNITGSGSAKASIGAGLNLSVYRLQFDGVTQLTGTTWGSTSSSAAHTNNTYFAATTGFLTIAP